MTTLPIHVSTDLAVHPHEGTVLTWLNIRGLEGEVGPPADPVGDVAGGILAVAYVHPRTGRRRHLTISADGVISHYRVWETTPGQPEVELVRHDARTTARILAFLERDLAGGGR